MKVLVGLEGEAMVPPDPEIIVHVPVPTEGELPAKVVVVSPHIEEPDWSGPASAVVGIRWNVIITSSDDEPHGEFVIVHRKVYDVPAVPVKVLTGLEGVAIVPPVPDTMLHNPVPTTGALPASVVFVSPHIEELI